MSASPKRAEFDAFTVERVSEPGMGPDERRYALAIADRYARVFDVGTGSTTTPGWLSDVRFASYDLAVEFGMEITPTLVAASGHLADVNRLAKRIVDQINEQPRRP